MAENIKSLVIDVEKTSELSGVRNAWTVLGEAGKFIRDIKTQDLSKKANAGSLVSGIPTAFARVDLFDAAMSADSVNDNSTTSKNLVGYYKDLVSEWRGFVACIGLDYPNIKVKRVNLVYSDGKPIDKTSNIYEPAGAFGNMLLRRRERWCEQSLSDNVKGVPFINIIKYCGNVVGATAPEILLFTSSGYKVGEKAEDRKEKPWVDVHTGKFIDPLKSELPEIELKTLYAYVQHILEKLPAIETYYPQELGVDYGDIRLNLEHWLEEMKEYASNRNYGVAGGTIPPVDAGFSGPFADVFTYEDRLSGLEGIISDGDPLQGSIVFDPKKLLLPPSAKLTRIHLNPEYSKHPEKLKDLPVLLLSATKKDQPGEKAFFALPLSALGLNVYGKSIGALLNDNDFSSNLTATYDPNLEEDNIEVELSIRTENGNLRRYCQRYTAGNDSKMLNKDILIWPNFISKQWNQYYMYSELPHNYNQGVSAYPFVGNVDDPYFRVVTDDNKEPVLLAENEDIIAPPEVVDVELLIRSGHAVADNPYKYEIYRSNKPFKGVRLKAAGGEEGGYLIINYSNDPTSALPRNLLETSTGVKEVTLGIDFGSTNTSVAYSDRDGKSEGFSFSNQRVSLLDQERTGAKMGLQESRVLFFQAPEKPVKSNSLHSVLTVHDERRLGKRSQGETVVSQLSREVEGGFPCFIDNLPVNHVTEDVITLDYPKIGQIQQIYNMKWTSDDRDKAHKKAYLRSLMLHIYAEMFRMGKVPARLRWSFPSAMSTQLLSQYKEIWNELSQLTPVLDANDLKPIPLMVSAPSVGVKMSQPAGASAGGGRKPLGRNGGRSNVQPVSGGTSSGVSYVADPALENEIADLRNQESYWMQQLNEPMAKAVAEMQLKDLRGKLQVLESKRVARTAVPGGDPALMAQLAELQQQEQYWTQQLQVPMAKAVAEIQIKDIKGKIGELKQKLMTGAGQSADAAVAKELADLKAQEQYWMQQLNVPMASAVAQQQLPGIRSRIKELEAQASAASVADSDPVSEPIADSLDPGMSPDDPNRIVRYEPEPLFSKKMAEITGNSLFAMTEANAVANFLSEEYGDERKKLILCFDIGGSTTDITALYRLRPGITMVKQNSIRFAAQRVSEATRKIKLDKFKSVLLQVCEKYGLTILGLNNNAKSQNGKDDKFSADTAPYYFNQIVDLLTEEQLPTFYQLISSRCPELMWVNMYVTGLLMYYGGQVTAKLVEDIEHLDPEEADYGAIGAPEKILVTFAGKGSRLFQWLPTEYPEAAYQYYNSLFIQGFGGADCISEDDFEIKLPTVGNSKNVKYEVSKGLAKSKTDLHNPKNDTPSEIIGESGFEVVSRDNVTYKLSDINTVTPEMIENIGKYFYPTQPYAEKFREFCDTFDTISRKLFPLKIGNDFFDKYTKEMNIGQYIQNMPEFKRAAREKDQNDGKFDFVAPIIILEGMKFYDDYLLKPLQ
ncbi:MAG: hypothetical protein K2G85_00090 [Muribaculaceae bacterium]|nr:hypothetical protein [Muribaculaceae bacterium]